MWVHNVCMHVCMYLCMFLSICVHARVRGVRVRVLEHEHEHEHERVRVRGVRVRVRVRVCVWVAQRSVHATMLICRWRACLLCVFRLEHRHKFLHCQSAIPVHVHFSKQLGKRSELSVAAAAFKVVGESQRFHQAFELAEVHPECELVRCYGTVVV